MICEARLAPEEHRHGGRLSLKFAAVKAEHDGSGDWHLHPRSRPRQDGIRRITLEARSSLKTLNIDLTASEAAELMFALGSALEQAARDEDRAAQTLVQQEIASGSTA